MMNLNNYNAVSQLPTDVIARDVIPFAEEVGVTYEQLKWEAQMDEIFGEVYVATL